MAITVEKKTPDGRPFAVRVKAVTNVEKGQWVLDPPGLVEVEAGGTVTWEFSGLSRTDRPAIRVVAAKPSPAEGGQLVFFDPFETLDQTGNEIVGKIFPEARGHYR